MQSWSEVLRSSNFMAHYKSHWRVETLGRVTREPQRLPRST